MGAAALMSAQSASPAGTTNTGASPVQMAVPAAVTHEICVAAPTDSANHPPFGAMYCCAVEDDEPRAQCSPCVPPTLVAARWRRLEAPPCCRRSKRQAASRPTSD